VVSDEARIGQKNSLTRVWGKPASRPSRPKDLGFASAYVLVRSARRRAKRRTEHADRNTRDETIISARSAAKSAADAHAVVILEVSAGTGAKAW